VYEKGHEMQQDPYSNERPIPNTSDAPYEQPTVEDERAVYPSARTRVYRYGRIIGYIGWAIAVLDILLVLRFFFKLIGADPQNSFAMFLYSFTGFFVYIFQGIVPNAVFGSSGRFIFEWSTIIAMIIYGILGWILTSFFRTRVTPPQQYIQ
jgi:hypothetical protein